MVMQGVFAERLMLEERRRMQDPQQIVDQLSPRTGIVVADLGCGPGLFTIPIALKVETREKSTLWIPVQKC